jgi:hypothetical protein
MRSLNLGYKYFTATRLYFAVVVLAFATLREILIRVHSRSLFPGLRLSFADVHAIQPMNQLFH